MWDYTFEQLIECHSVNLSAKSQPQLTELFASISSPLIYFLTSSKLASVHNRLLLARSTQGLQVLNHIRSCPIIQKIHFSTSCSTSSCHQILSTGILPHWYHFTPAFDHSPFFVSTQKEDHIPCGPLLFHIAQSRYGVTWLRVCMYTVMSNSIDSPFPSALSLTDLFLLTTL